MATTPSSNSMPSPRTLQEMDDLARKGFVTLLEQLAAEERNAALAAFIRAFAEDNGLVR